MSAYISEEDLEEEESESDWDDDDWRNYQSLVEGVIFNKN